MCKSKDNNKTDKQKVCKISIFFKKATSCIGKIIGVIAKPIRHRYCVFILIFLVIIVGAIVPFSVQFLLPFFFPDVNISGVELWNQYVSIILGVVATVLSVFSLFFSFISEGNANEINNKITSNLSVMKENLSNIDRKISDLKYSHSNINVSNVGHARQQSSTPNDESQTI